MIVSRFVWHRLAITLAVLALVVRMIVPAGFMPLAGAGGMPTLVICPGQQPLVTAAMPGMAHAMHQPAHSGPDKSAPVDHGGDHACPFAALGGAADTIGVAVALPLPALATALALSAPYFIRPGIGLAAPPPPKTGPPAFH